MWSLISAFSLGSRFTRKCVWPIQALIVPNMLDQASTVAHGAGLQVPPGLERVDQRLMLPAGVARFICLPVASDEDQPLLVRGRRARP
jgi:hypothetical protein